mmetsp:Transcript_36824/g.96468  ORF Transcript_36824/g.96468 Transcript_36824/m.96468 type:complete len:444 (-) Transcript_36824:113-1444(-)
MPFGGSTHPAMPTMAGPASRFPHNKAGAGSMRPEVMRPSPSRSAVHPRNAFVGNYAASPAGQGSSDRGAPRGFPHSGGRGHHPVSTPYHAGASGYGDPHQSYSSPGTSYHRGGSGNSGGTGDVFGRMGSSAYTPTGGGYQHQMMTPSGRIASSMTLFDSDGASSMRRSPQRSPRGATPRQRSQGRTDVPKPRGYSTFRGAAGKGDGIPTTPLSTTRMPSFDQSMSRRRTPGRGAKTPGGPQQLSSVQKRFATPGRMDPHFKHKGLHRQTFESKRHLAQDSVTISGFEPSVTADVLKEFEKCGPIVSKRITDCNWMHLKYSSDADAKKAIGRDGMILHDRHMLAVKACTDLDFAGTVDLTQDIGSHTMTVLNSPAVRRRPLASNAMRPEGGPTAATAPGSLQPWRSEIMWDYLLPDIFPDYVDRSLTMMVVALIFLILLLAGVV